MPEYIGYNPYGTYQGNYPRMYHGAAPAGMQPTQQALIRVTGYEGAKAYQMAPNSVVALFDGNQDVFFVKSTDGAGFPTIKAFAFTPIDASPAPVDYVTRQEFEELKGQVLNGKQSVRKSKSESIPEND